MRCILLPLLCATLAHAKNPGGIPAEYRLLYSQDFATADSAKDFLMSDPSAWTISRADGKAALELSNQSKYAPPFRSPLNIALLAGKAFGDVIFEADCQLTGK